MYFLPKNNLKSFEGPGFEDLRGNPARRVSTVSTGGMSWIQRNSELLWQIFDEPHSSLLAKVKYTKTLNPISTGLSEDFISAMGGLA